MKNLQLSESDLEQIRQHGLSKNAIVQQLEIFQKGIPPVHLEKAATIEDGILKLNRADRNRLVDIYDNSSKKTVKFVPASGSATRMFKHLFQFLNEFKPEDESLNEFLDTPEFKNLKPFFEHLKELPFYTLVKGEMKLKYPGYTPKSPDLEKYDFVRFLLIEMDFGSLPKGLIPFHYYENKMVTAFEEHLYEAAEYSVRNQISKLHFTVAEEHLDKFNSAFENIKSRVERNTAVTFEISHSFQEKSTDTIAVDEDNNPFRNEDGRLFFRPGGHGALIKNLNNIDADIVFIKNIDNVVTEENLSLVVTYKKALAGILITIQQDIFALLKEEDQNGFSKKIQREAAGIAEKYFGLKKKFASADKMRSFLNRPIRICGMVKNEGEPGGGPFWIKDQKGEVSLQIIEGVQMNKKDKEQIKIQQEATHFNPVDIVCGVKNYKGEKFDLLKFVNPNEGFITCKSVNGKPLKALELPGLWNGGMAHWNTVFVEVPLGTFNPVKTVADLLKPRHQVDCCS